MKIASQRSRNPEESSLITLKENEILVPNRKKQT